MEKAFNENGYMENPKRKQVDSKLVKSISSMHEKSKNRSQSSSHRNRGIYNLQALHLPDDNVEYIIMCLKILVAFSFTGRYNENIPSRETQESQRPQIDAENISLVCWGLEDVPRAVQRQGY